MTESNLKGKIKTTCESGRFCFIWKIENFSQLSCQKDDWIKSPPFPVLENVVELILYPKGHTNSRYSAIYVRNLQPIFQHNVPYVIWIWDADKKACKVFGADFRFDYPGTYDREFNLFSLCDASEESFLPDDVLTVYCSVNLPGSGMLNRLSLPTREASVEDSLESDLEAFCASRKFSDFSLIVENEEYPVHKVVLAARSTVFDAMFQDMHKRNINYTVITDIPRNVMNTFLSFIYSGKVEKLSEEMARNLYVAAEKYNMPELKDVCREHLIFYLDTENLFQIASLCSLYNDSDLKLKVKDFFYEKMDKIFLTESWSQLLKKNSSLAFEWLQSILVAPA